MGIRARLEQLNRQIEDASRDAGREGDVTLIAVSKNFPVEAIQEAYDAGQRHFGESRLQDALPKIEVLPKDIVWHFVGKLQSNKAKRIAERFDVIHTLENERQVAEIAKTGRKIQGFIEVNIAEEAQKSGIFPRQLDEVTQFVLDCPYIQLCGLMTVGPAQPNAEAMRPYFAEMRRLAKERNLSQLSMGMSNDFDVAIQEGATHVRIGTALFGARNKTT